MFWCQSHKGIFCFFENLHQDARHIGHKYIYTRVSYHPLTFILPKKDEENVNSEIAKDTLLVQKKT